MKRTLLLAAALLGMAANAALAGRDSAAHAAPFGCQLAHRLSRASEILARTLLGPAAHAAWAGHGVAASVPTPEEEV